MKLIFVGLAIFMLAGCGGAQRWLDSNNEDVQIEGATYRVSWLRVAGGIDVRSHRNESLVLLPDALVEKRRNVEAASLVARRECRSKVSIATESKDGDMFFTSLRCEP